MRIVVTGGCGFIGSNYVLRRLRTTEDEVVNLDKLTDVSNRANLAEIEADPRYTFLQGDIADREAARRALEGAEAVVNFAAESHVDRSITDAGAFYKTNVEGTLVLLEESLRAGVRRFVQISTDEVYGSLGAEGSFHEELPLRPNSPYAASKGGADLLVRSFVKTHGLSATITRCCNNYGPFQFPEKLIPLMIIRALGDSPLPVYGDGSNVRDWIHVKDHCRAVDLALEKGAPGEIYNIGARSEMPNLGIVKTLLRHLGKPETLLRFVEDRPGHDWRYSIDPTKIERDLGWRPERSLEEGLEDTVRWYLDRRDWWEAIMNRPAWRAYFSAMYDERLAGARTTPR
ncbi:MAG: dTDP-glucose 4,6-dehydratase [Candidatus Eisenbacteria bacterium]|nr:dTDP-glucose 4,6-dehydratase [Candidatus Eisenbacteria bacterium]